MVPLSLDTNCARSFFVPTFMVFPRSNDQTACLKPRIGGTANSTEQTTSRIIFWQARTSRFRARIASSRSFHNTVFSHPTDLTGLPDLFLPGSIDKLKAKTNI